MNCLNCGKEVENKFCGTSCQNEYKGRLNRENYYKNPKFCKCCGKIIDFEKRKNSFCSHSCSATFINNTRQPLTIEEKEIRKCKMISTRTKKGINFYKKERVCKVCGKTYFYTQGLNTKKVCSKECSEYLKTHYKEFLSKESLNKLQKAGLKSVCKQKEKRRSKNEIYFYDLCSIVFKDIKHNEPIFDGWDADVILEKYKIAILWNGPWHYKQIKKNTSLKQIQNRDVLKIEKIKNSGYTPYIIKDMGKHNKKFVEKEFIKLINNLRNVRSGILQVS